MSFIQRLEELTTEQLNGICGTIEEYTQFRQNRDGVLATLQTRKKRLDDINARVAQIDETLGQTRTALNGEGGG